MDLLYLSRADVEGLGLTMREMNMGIAVDDMVTAKLLYDRTRERGAGTRLPL